MVWLSGIFQAERLAVVIICEKLRVATPADDGAQSLLGGLFVHVVLELVEEAALGGAMARPLIQHPPDVRGKGHISDHVSREELLALIRLAACELQARFGQLLSPPPPPGSPPAGAPRGGRKTSPPPGVAPPGRARGGGFPV